MMDQKYNSFLQLIEQFPADKFRWSKSRILTLEEALFISYGTEPPTQQNPVLMLNFNHFLTFVDIHHIYELSKRAVLAGDLQMYDKMHVKSLDFVKWASENEIPIKTEFFFAPSTINEIEKSCNKNAIGKKLKPETLRKEIFRNAAQLYWRKEENELGMPQSKLKEYTRPTKLACSKDMAELAKLVNRIGGLKPIEDSAHSDSGVDPEWFGDLYPGKNKPGPKAKVGKKSS